MEVVDDEFLSFDRSGGKVARWEEMGHLAKPGIRGPKRYLRQPRRRQLTDPHEEYFKIFKKSLRYETLFYRTRPCIFFDFQYCSYIFLLIRSL